MNHLPCITTTMRGRPCIVRGEHLEACLWAQIEAAAVVEGVSTGMVMQARAEVGLAVPARECRGCLPRPAEHGLLCDSCWPKWVDALSIAVDLITHLRSVDRGAQSVDGVRVAQGSKVLVPASWLAADQLWTDLASLTFALRDVGDRWPAGTAVVYGGSTVIDGWFLPTATLDQVAAAASDFVADLQVSPEAVVARPDAAVEAVEFFRHVQTQLHRFPMDDAAIPLPNLRCRRCGLFMVRQHPPLHFLAERIMKCDVCDHEADPLLVDWDLKLYAQEVWEAMTREERARLLPDLDVDERRVLRELNRSDVETARAKVWDLLGERLTKPGRVLWYNTARPAWGGLNADQMIEAGRGDEVRCAVERLTEGNIA